MKPKTLLRIAAVLMSLHTIGHAMGALSWRTAPNAAVARVITGMENNHFDFMGQQASLAAFYDGYGVSMIFVLLLVSALLWLASNETENTFAARVLGALTVFLLVLAGVEYIYFFAFAAAFSLLAGLCGLSACVRISQNKAQVLKA